MFAYVLISGMRYKQIAGHLWEDSLDDYGIRKREIFNCISFSMFWILSILPVGKVNIIYSHKLPIT